jgi:hypothetical protein
MKDLQEHHLGGFQHAPFFTITLCQPHHQSVSIAIVRAGVNPQYTNIVEERKRRARMTAYVFLWWLDEATVVPEQAKQIRRDG